MKILHVLSGPRAEGTPRLLLDWLTVDSPDEHDVLFFKGDGELRADYDVLPNWIYYNSAFELSFLNFWRIRSLVYRTVKERAPDVVLSWNHGISPWVALGAKQAGCTRILAHAGNFPGPRYAFSTVFHTNVSSWMHRLCGGKIICCSRYVKDSYRRIPLVPVSVYYWVNNCFKHAAFDTSLSWDERNLDCIMVATLEAHKDHKTLLEAWKIVEAKANISLQIVGDGSLNGKLQDYAKSLGISSVKFLGSRNDVPQLLSRSKVFIFSTTVQEGFGTVLLEALASGCKVIASDVPACREVLQDGRYGTLVSPGDSKALAEEILGAFMQGNQVEEEQNKIYLSTFSPQKMKALYLKIAS